MIENGQQFLDVLAAFPAHTFESDFAQTSTGLGLGKKLTPEELSLLFDAAYNAALCNIAFNGLGGCQGLIRPQREPNRVWLENEFMDSRQAFFASRGWKRLARVRKASVQRIFLHVEVNPDKLAW
jgi:hypothetical protein